MEKKLKISLDLDDRAFASAIKKMQDQLGKINSQPQLLAQQKQINQRMQQLGLGSLPGSPGERQMEQAQQKAKQESNKLFEETKRKMDVIKRLQKDYNKELENEEITQKRILEVKEKLAGLSKMEFRATGEMAALTGPYRMPGSGGRGFAPSSGMGITELTKKVLGVLGIGIGASALVNLGKEVYSSYVSLPYRMTMATGSAVQSNLGYQNQNILTGNVAQMTALQSQVGLGRQKAQETYDKSFSAILNPDRLAAIALSVLHSTTGLVSGTAGQGFYNQYQATRAQTIGANTQTAAQQLLKENNDLQLALDFFNQTFERNIAAERALGLGTAGFRGMQGRVAGAGFTSDQAIGMLTQIQSAGGAASGANASPLATLGLQMQRGYNLTNSGNILGKLTGLYGPGGGSQVDETTKRILQESISKGLDRSENTEILRRFTEKTSELIYGGEARTPADVDRLARDLLQLLPSNASTKQFEAASSAYQKIQQATSQTSGRGGALGFAAFMRSPNFSRLSTLQIGNLQALPENMITATNTDVISAATQQGISPQQMVQSILSAKQQQQLATGGITQRGVGAINKYLGKRDISSVVRNFSELNKLKTSNPQVYKAINQLQERANLVSGGFSSDEEKVRMMEGLLKGPAGYAPLGGTAGVTATLTGGLGGKKEEAYIAAQAAAEKQMVDNLSRMENQIYSTASKVGELTKALVGLGDASSSLNEQERARAALMTMPIHAINANPMARMPSSGSKARPGQ